MTISNGYAQAIYDVAKADGVLPDVEEELFRFQRTLEANPDLLQGLSNPGVPAARRQEMIEELLKGKAHVQTIYLLSMVVGTGNGRRLPEIIAAFLGLSARARNRGIALVRSAVELTPKQQNLLEEALQRATGKEVETRIVVDPSVIGGLRVEIGDQVIDGTVRSRLDHFRENLRRA